MNILVIILLSLAALILFLLLLGLFMRKHNYVKREIIINAPQQKVFAYIKLLKNQDEFNTHAQAGAERERVYNGTDGTVGFVYAWKGDKDAGEGEKEIKKIIDGKTIESEIRFTKPIKATATIIMDTESVQDGQTKVSWSNEGILKYPVNIMIPMMERMLPKEMDKSLAKLKSLMEQNT